MHAQERFFADALRHPQAQHYAFKLRVLRRKNRFLGGTMGQVIGQRGGILIPDIAQKAAGGAAQAQVFFPAPAVRIVAAGIARQGEIADFVLRKAVLGQRFPANAFLVQINNNGKKEIWGVTTKVLAHSYGPKVILRAKHNGKEIEIPAEVAQEGPRRLSDIALLKVPQELPQEVEALEVAEEYDQTAPVSLYTFNKENLLSFPALHLQKDNGYFLRMDFANQVETPQSIFYTTLGAPIVSNGKAVGVFCRRNENGGYGSSLSMLPYLVKNVTQPYQTTTIPFKIKNYDFGEIDIDETIISVLALDEKGRTIGIEFFNKELHQSSVLRFINNLKTNSLRFDLHKANGQNRYLFYSPKHNLHWSVSH